MQRFPMALFAPSEWSWRIAGAAIEGGQPITGPPQTAEVSGGGYWIAEWTPALLSATRALRIWRALVADLTSGVVQIEVPVLDMPAGALVPFADGSTFGDGTELVSGSIEASLASAVYMPAYPAPPASPNVAQIAIASGQALGGGEYFAIVGPSGFAKLHMVTQVNAVDGDVSTVTVRPPFREDMPAGTTVDFDLPRCVMKADISQIEKAWPRMRGALIADAAITFLESGFVTPT